MRMRARPHLEQGRELMVFGALWETEAIESQRAAASSPYSRADDGPHPLVGQESVCSLWLLSSLRTNVFYPPKD